jgi:hypothetical protein
MTTIDPSVIDQFGREYEGFPIHLQALSSNQWLIVLQARPCCRLRLSQESELTKQLDRLGFSDEDKVGNPSVDEAYVIRAESAQAQELLRQPEIHELIQQLTPFLELEFTQKEYRLIKDGIAPSAQAVEAVLKPLSQLARATHEAEVSEE